MNFVVSGRKDAVLALIADKLMKTTRHPSVVSEASFYALEYDVPYIAETLHRSMTMGGINFDIPDYWILCSDKMVLDSMHPVRAKSIADKILLSLATVGRVPLGYTEQNAITLGTLLYGLGASKHPDQSLRPTLECMSRDLPVWVKALPHFQREISLVL